MTTNIDLINRAAYLRSTRQFPEESKLFAEEVNKSYLDIAKAVNDRTIGIFPTTKPAITGEAWFITGNIRQQTLRQIYPFGVIAPGTFLSIPYFIPGFLQFTRIYGTALTAQPDSRPIPYASVGVNSNIDLRVDTVNFNIIIGNGAGAPQINSGIIILEWLTLNNQQTTRN